MQITAVVPTSNEAGNLPGLIESLAALPLEDLRVLVVDDASPDGTGQIADELARQDPGRVSVLHRERKMGLGTAYLAGFQHVLETGAEAIAQMDADLSHPPELLLEFVEALRSCDLVVGSRYVPGGSVDRSWPLWRKGLSAFGSLYAHTILRLPVRDLTSGFKLWRRSTLLGIPLQRVSSNGYAFQIEMTYLAHRMGYRIRELPFYFPDREWGRSKISFAIQIEAALRVWQLLFEYRDLEARSEHQP